MWADGWWSSPGGRGYGKSAGRAELSWEDTVRFDVRCVENWPSAPDLPIPRKTVALIGGRGAY